MKNAAVPALERNQAALESDPGEVIRELVHFLLRAAPRFFRWLSSGDLCGPGWKLREVILEVCRQTPGTRHLVFTKSGWDPADRPDNLTIIHSTWGGWDAAPAPDSPRAIFRPKSDRGRPLPDGAFLCPGDCPDCGRRCWSAGPGFAVVFDQH